jgi:hypothetical protein
MPTDRSRENKKLGQQLYAVIEFCNAPAALYAKIDSGLYDWLGVRRKDGRDTFVVGSPRRGGVGLVLQPHFNGCASSDVVAAACTGLVSAAPA